MKLLALLAVVALAALVLIAKAKKGSKLGDAPWPFFSKKPLSAPELALYVRLVGMLPDHMVLAQVALSRILGVKKGNNFGEWFNRINRMSLDFVVCSKDATIVAVIELDDASHERVDRQEADAKKDKALASAGIRVLRWQIKAIPSEAVIKSEFGYTQTVPSPSRSVIAQT